MTPESSLAPSASCLPRGDQTLSGPPPRRTLGRLCSGWRPPPGWGGWLCDATGLRSCSHSLNIDFAFRSALPAPHTCTPETVTGHPCTLGRFPAGLLPPALRPLGCDRGRAGRAGSWVRMARCPPLPWGHFPLALVWRSHGLTDAVWMTRQQSKGWLLASRPPCAL